MGILKLQDKWRQINLWTEIASLITKVSRSENTGSEKEFIFNSSVLREKNIFALTLILKVFNLLAQFQT